MDEQPPPPPVDRIEESVQMRTSQLQPLRGYKIVVSKSKKPTADQEAGPSNPLVGRDEGHTGTRPQSGVRKDTNIRIPIGGDVRPMTRSSARKNAEYRLPTPSSSDDSDFVDPPRKRKTRSEHTVPNHSPPLVQDTVEGNVEGDEDVPPKKAKKGGHPNVASCSPSLLQSFISKALTEQMWTTIAQMGFEGVLNLAARSLDDRDFLTWLMDMFNPEEMCSNVGGGKKLEVILGLPSEGSDPPLASEDSAKEAYKEVAARLFPDEPEPKSVKIHPTKVAEAIVKYRNDGDPELDDDFCIRLFFMVLNINLLTPNTSCYIRNVDAHWCRNLESIAHYNWCKIVHDNLRDAGRKWKLCRRLNKDRPPILGCSILLIIYYLDNLMIHNGLDAFHTPRFSLYTSEVIRSMQHSDKHKNENGPTCYGKNKCLHSLCEGLKSNTRERWKSEIRRERQS